MSFRTASAMGSMLSKAQGTDRVTRHGLIARQFDYRLLLGPPLVELGRKTQGRLV